MEGGGGGQEYDPFSIMRQRKCEQLAFDAQLLGVAMRW